MRRIYREERRIVAPLVMAFLQDDDFLYALFAQQIHRERLVFDLAKIDEFHVDAANAVVVGGFVVNQSIAQVDDRCPLRSTWQDSPLMFANFDTDRNVEAVQQMKGLHGRGNAIFQFGRGGNIERGSNKT